MAATTELNILVKLRDEASAALGKVGDQLQGLAKSTQPALLASNAVAAGLLGIGAAGVAGGVMAVNAARETVKINNQLEAVLKSTGNAAQLSKDDILDHSAALAKLTNFEDDAITSAQNLLLTFTNIKGPVFQQATGVMLDMAAAMGTDAKGGAIQLGKALNDPVAGISALSRVGVTFTDDQKKMIEGMVEAGKTADAQKVILAELAKEFGGSAAAQLDPITKLKQSFGELAEQIGLKLLPFVNKFADIANHFTSDILPQWIDRSKEIIQWLREHQAVVAMVAGGIMGALVPALLALLPVVWGMVTAFAASAVALAPFIIGGAIIAGIVMGVLWIIKHWDLIMAKATEVWNWVVAQFTALKNQVMEIFTSIGNFFTEVWNVITGIFNFAISLLIGLVIVAFKAMGIDIVAVFQTVADFLTEFWALLTKAFTVALDFIKMIWTAAWTAISGYFIQKWNEIKTAVSTGWEFIKNIFNTATQPLQDAWAGMWEGMKGTFTSIWDTIKSVLTSSLNWIIDKINKVINTANSIADMGSKLPGVNISHIPNIPKLAKGGIVNSPTLALIGEAGPEAVVPLSGRMAGAGFGGITIQIMGPIYTGREHALELVEEIADEIKRRRTI